MPVSRRLASSVALATQAKPLVGAVTIALLMGSSSYAATMGHSRLVSSAGQALRIDVPVKLSADELGTLSVSAAPAGAWAQAGLTPPVDLSSLKISIVKGVNPNTQLIRLSSSQAFDQPVADVLLDVRTASGQQRYQASLLAYAGKNTTRPPSTASATSSSAPKSGVAAQPAPKRIHVKHGDTMFAIAKRNAVPDVTIFQMMIALERANPKAFIHGNLNLVKAGATLVMPNKAALTAISDQEARRIYQQQAQAFALYQQRLGAGAAVLVPAGNAAQGVVAPAGGELAQQDTPAPRDQLRLSGASAAKPHTGSDSTDSTVTRSGPIAEAGSRASPANSSGSESPAGSASTSSPSQAAASSSKSASQAADDVRADDTLAMRKDIQESSERVSTLEQNVKHLNQALQAQGEAAKDLVVSGALEISRSLTDAATVVTDAATGIVGGQDTAPGAATVSPADSAPNATIAASSAPDATAPHKASNGSATGSSSGGADTKAKPTADRSVSSGSGTTAAIGGAAAKAKAADSGSAANQTERVSQPVASKADQIMMWIHEHLLGAITAVLALIVLIIAWLLRRANAARDDDNDGHNGRITEAMVQEKLEHINLELDRQPAADSGPRS